MKPSRDIAALLELMARLRTPDGGCPWDLEQDFRSIAPYTIEEAYEVADAIETGDMEDLRDELGDLLLQVVFHAQMAAEAQAFDFGGVVEAITTKMIRRHPHVFGDVDASDPKAVKARWSEIKAEEKSERAARRRARGEPEEVRGQLSGVPHALPGLTRALKLQERASKVGFDWNDPRAVIAKIREELEEIEAELDGPGAADRIEDECGDVLFSVANLARHLKIDPEAAIRRCNAKFERRFGYIEGALAARGVAMRDVNLDEMEALWKEAKVRERA